MNPEETLQKIKALAEEGLDPYVNAYRYEVTAKAEELKAKFSYLQPGEETEHRVSVAGRLWHVRRHGGITFMDLRDESGRIQLVVRRDIAERSERLSRTLKFLDKGDIVGAKGRVIRTKTGEISVLAEEIEILSIAWRPIPFHEFGVKDPEQRYRERYLDIMLNSRVRGAIVGLYKVEREMRRILDEKGFIEVHTPKLQPIYGGALAKPFVTKINALDRTVYLSIAPETYLKRLVVAGLFKVYEIAVSFRNEDIDATHYPEFVQLEAYQAFADWEDMMSLGEELIAEAVRALYGSYRVEREDGTVLDFSRPWPRVNMVEAIEEALKTRVRDMSREELEELAGRLGVEARDPRAGKIMEKIFEKVAMPRLRNPTFVTMFPRDISPLARPSRQDPRFAERFELYIAGLEVANGYSELNNPVLQYYFFKEEEELRKALEAESHPMDRDYVRALEYGLPPTGGIGIGLYRLMMAITGLPSIKDVIPFTITSPENIELVSESLQELAHRYL
ncbi:MAG: lysine--tRNA ligase [Acidilobaceae archaeon]|nr:lysine--tRNA ligase [Acidilobaceae archaeon]